MLAPGSPERRLQSAQQALIGSSHLFTGILSETPQQFFLCFGELGWHVDRNDRSQIAAPFALNMGNAAPTQSKLSSVLRASRDAEIFRAVERLELDVGSESGLGNRDRHSRHQIVALAGESVVRPHLEVHIKITF